MNRSLAKVMDCPENRPKGKCALDPCYCRCAHSRPEKALKILGGNDIYD